MGCCLSSSKKPPQPSKPIISKSPPPEPETVKEVLSSLTPNSKHHHYTSPRRALSHHHHIPHNPFIKSAPLLPDFNKRPINKPTYDDVSEETHSNLSESVSISTSLNETKQIPDPTRHRSPGRVKNRSFSGDLKREKAVGKSPGRRSDPSPGRARPGSGPGGRKDSGESSGRRSRSPVTRAEMGTMKKDLGRSPSARKTGRSPGRVGSGLGDRVRRLDDGGGNKWPLTSAGGGKNDDSIENPLVSLECFIFL